MQIRTAKSSVVQWCLFILFRSSSTFFFLFFIRARNKRPHVEIRVVGAVGSRPIPISV